jgi:serine/threonine protein kinase
MSERDIFISALEQNDPAQRRAYLERACGGNSDLRRRVDILLDAHERANSFLAAPLVEDMAEAIRPDLPTSTADPTGKAGDHWSLNFLDPPEQPGQLGKLGDYEVLEVVGRGGMGVVLKAFDPKLRRVVAIKAMASHLAAHAGARRRFEREARAIAAVRNEHVVAVFNVEPDAPTPYLVMEFIGGTSLEDRLAQRGPLELKEILRIGMQAASGLVAARAQGIVHRDIKPANILLENGVERVKLTDFGLARAVNDASLTQSGAITGTPYYMSPEQASADPVDHRSDLFSLGAVLYAMCTGRPPFRAETPLGVLKRVCEDEPRPIREINPEIPDWLDAIVLKLLAKDPADRFQSAAELGDLLGRHLAHLQQPGIAPKPKDLEWPRRRLHRRFRIRRPVFAVWAAITLLVVVVVVVKAIHWQRSIWGMISNQATLSVVNEDPTAQVIISDGVNRVVDITGRSSASRSQDANRDLSLSIRKDREIYYETFRVPAGEKRDIRIPPIVLSSRMLQLKTKSGRLETEQIQAMRLSPDRQWVAVRLGHGSLKVFDLKDGVERWSFPLPKNEALGFDFSPNGKWLAYVAREPNDPAYVVVTRNLATTGVGPILRPGRETFLSNARALAFSPGGKEIAVSSAYNFAPNDHFKSRILRWSWPEGEPLSTIEWGDGTIEALRYSTNSRKLAAIIERGIYTVSFEPENNKSTIDFGEFSNVESKAIAFSASGKLAAANWDGHAQIMISQGDLIDASGHASPSMARFPVKFARVQFACLAFSPDEKLIAAGNFGGAFGRFEDRAAVHIWGTYTESAEKAMLLGHTDWVLDLKFGDDGKEVVTASKDGSVMFWRLP